MDVIPLAAFLRDSNSLTLHISGEIRELSAVLPRKQHDRTLALRGTEGTRQETGRG